MDFNIDELISEYKSGESSVSLGKKYNMSAPSVVYRLRKAGVEMRSNKDNSRRYTVDHDYFEVIDSSEKAYWLGFMFADGYVSNAAGKRVGCSILSKDHSHLDKFVKALKSDYKVNKYKSETSYGSVEYSRLLIASDKMYDDLVKHGCIEHKSKVLSPPADLPELYEVDFIRGYIDGDGSVALARGARSGVRIKAVGTESVIRWIADRFENPSVYQDTRHDNVWNLDSRFDETVWKRFYENSSISLERKFARALHGHKRLSRVACDCPEICSAGRG